MSNTHFLNSSIMKQCSYAVILLLIISACSGNKEIKKETLHNGFYEVVQAVNNTSEMAEPLPQQALVMFDTLFNPGDQAKALIDTRDYVPLELDSVSVEKQSDAKKLLSVALTPAAAEKMRSFSASRVMKHVAIVIDGKAITMHKIREAITGNRMQITRCDDNACEYLYVKMQGDLKK